MTCKIQLHPGSNEDRAEINIGVAETDPQRVITFMSAVTALADSEIHFCVQQSGNIWTLLDHKLNHKVELVVYRMLRLRPSLVQGCFLEIEPLKWRDLSAAIALIDQYEGAMGLEELSCKYSIAELFRPGNEDLLMRTNP